MNQFARAASCLLTAVFALSTVQAFEVYVANDDATVSVIDTDSNLVVASIPVTTPMGAGQPVWGVAASTLPGDGATHAFVTGGNWLFVIDVATHAVVQRWDVAAMLGVPGILELRGCAAGLPTEFMVSVGGGGGTITEVHSLLYVAATQASLASSANVDARFVVLDQACLVAGDPCDPLVASDLLAVGDVTAIDVTALDEISGSQIQRAWFTLLDRDAHTIRSVLVSASGLTDFAVRDSRETVIDSADPLPALVRVAAPPQREFAVATLGSLGLVNLSSPGDCDPAGEFVAVGVSGPGPNSDTVFAVAGDTQELRVLNPDGCTGDTFSVGANPVDVAILEKASWESVFVANHDSHTVTRVNSDGTFTAIDLCPPLGGCDRGPNSLDVFTDKCRISEVSVSDELGSGLVELDWIAVGCPVEDYSLWCMCMEFDPSCPCFCSCDGSDIECNGADTECCACPPPSTEFNEGVLINKYEWEMGPVTHWKKLGTVPPFIHDTLGFDLSYRVTMGPPPPLP